MDDPHQVLLDTLQAMQAERNLSQSKFATDILGISQQMWNYALNDERRLGPQSLNIIRQRLPHLKPLIVAVLTTPQERKPKRRKAA